MTADEARKISIEANQERQPEIEADIAEIYEQIAATAQAGLCRCLCRNIALGGVVERIICDRLRRNGFEVEKDGTICW